VQVIAQTLTEVFERADREGVPTSVIADRIAEERIRSARAKRTAPEVAPARAVAG
jgi:hypothetical protein